jgi:hypothetical protein
MKLNFRVNDTMHETSVDRRLTLPEREWIYAEWQKLVQAERAAPKTLNPGDRRTP